MQKADSGRLTDEQLRHDLAEGLSQAQIARKHGISPAAVSKRVNRLTLTTSALTSTAPDESRAYVEEQLTAIARLATPLARVNLLMDACDEWLRDPNDPSKYDVGARSHEIMVTYWDHDDTGKAFRAKKCLDDLLKVVEKRFAVERSETKFADPRELILKTAQEVRQTVTAAVELMERIHDVAVMERFRAQVLDVIRSVSADDAQTIAAGIRPLLVLPAAE